jgi:hypothetical protein
MTMNNRLESGKAMIRTNRPTIDGLLRRGESDSVAGSVGCNALHQGATAGLGLKPDARHPLIRRQIRVVHDCAKIRSFTTAGTAGP